jgi:hypothetical protein
MPAARSSSTKEKNMVRLYSLQGAASLPLGMGRRGGAAVGKPRFNQLALVRP